MVISTVPEIDEKEHTLAIYPQERTSGFPFRKYSAAKEPLSGSIMLDTTCDDVIS